MKELRNASSLLPIKLALMISDLDLFAIVSGRGSSVGITPGTALLMRTEQGDDMNQ